MKAYCRVSVVFVVVACCSWPSLAQGQQPTGGAVPSMSSALRIPADSLYNRVKTRLKARGDRLDEADSLQHRLVVRAPDIDARVDVRIVQVGDSSTITFMPLGGGTLGDGLRAVIVVTHDAMIELPEEPTSTPADSGELPEARWRPELRVSPGGRLWLARGGLYTADSPRGGWRLVLGRSGDPVGSDDLRIGISMAFVDERTVLVGLPDDFETRGPHIYRTTDGGKLWSPVPVDVAWVDAMTAIGTSVWVLGTRWENHVRRGTFIRSSDGGATWVRSALPTQLNDITHVYRLSPDTAYVATAGFNRGPVFWRTDDSGKTWLPVPTPRDQGVNDVPSYGVRVEEIATVGEWLVVREYGRVFVTRADSIHWRALDGVEHVAADLELDRLFVLTDSLHAAMLDRNLKAVWRTLDSVPDASPSNVEQVIARSGVGYVSMSHSEVYEARDGTLRLVRPRRTAK